jgi:two-component system sensor histidine kinase AlgZ
MASSIRQNSAGFALPDLRNLGTVLRILLAVNGASAVIALARAPSPDGFAAEWTAISGYVEPHLLLQLALLWLGAPWLARMPSRSAAVVIAAIGVAVALVVNAAIASFVPASPFGLTVHLVYTLLATAALLYYFNLRAKALSPAIAEARLQALQARIRPHFLFNSINGVLSLVREDPRRAEEALHDLADLFRVLMRDNRNLAPLADEVELCRQYLELEKLRLGERLIVDWNVKSMPGDALVPPLVLQPLLENAVYHGIEPQQAPGTVSINIFLSKGDVHAILRNPYRANGGHHHKGNKMALDNVRERLALHFDAEASLESRVLTDAYEVHIRMPYRTVAPPEPAAPQRSQGAAPRQGPGTPPAARAARPVPILGGVHA